MGKACTKYSLHISMNMNMCVICHLQRNRIQLLTLLLGWGFFPRRSTSYLDIVTRFYCCYCCCSLVLGPCGFFPPWKCWSHVSLYSLRTRKEADTTSGNFSNLCCCCCKVARGWKETTEWKLLHSVKYGQGHMYVKHVIRILSVCSYFEHIRL